MTQKELTEETLLSARTTRYGIKQLESVGVIETAPSLSDARQTCYGLTTASETGTEYATDALVEAEWVVDRLGAFADEDPALRLVEVDADPNSYEEAHVPGAIGFTWDEDLVGQTKRGLPERSAFETLLGEHGITDESTVVLYGDESNWFAAYAYWLFTYYGHDDLYLLNGGRNYWLANDFETTTDVPSYTPREYRARGPFEHVRAVRRDVEEALTGGKRLIDVRNEEEYTGAELAPPGKEVTAQVGGHIPGAIHVAWSETVGDDGRFKSRSDLAALFRDRNVTEDGEFIVYCRLGERSALAWFVLSELLGYDDVSNYDGSWTEWGNLVDAPVETPES